MSKTKNQKMKEEINRLERQLWNYNQKLANSFSTSDRNQVIKTTIRLTALKEFV